MKKKHIVVLYSDNPSRLDHLNKLNSLRKKYYITLIMDKKDDKEWQSKFVDEKILIEMNLAIENIDDIVKLIIKNKKPDGIINLSELCVPLYASLTQKFKLNGITEEMALISRDKYLMRKFSKKLGIKVPNFYIIDDKINSILKKIKFPVIVKPIIGGGSGLIKKIERKKDFFLEIDKLYKNGELYKKDPLFKKYLKNNNLSFIVEEIVEGQTQFETIFPYKVGEISVESIWFNNELYILAIHDKPIPSNGPYFEEHIWSTPTRISEKLQEKAKEYVYKIHKNTQSPVLHTEFRTYENELVLLEFGARLGGGPIYNSILTSTSNDYIEILIDISLNKKPKINKIKKYPTITHCLWTSKEGKLKNIEGLSKGILNPFYNKLQIYDDINEKIFRAPLSTRAQGHIVFCNNLDNDFKKLEESVKDALEKIKINSY